MISQHTIHSFKGPPLPRAEYPKPRLRPDRGQPECHLCQRSPIMGQLEDGKWRCESCTRLATVTPPAKTTASYYKDDPQRFRYPAHRPPPAPATEKS